jgi:hypothetical protein
MTDGPIGRAEELQHPAVSIDIQIDPTHEADARLSLKSESLGSVSRASTLPPLLSLSAISPSYEAISRAGSPLAETTRKSPGGPFGEVDLGTESLIDVRRHSN